MFLHVTKARYLKDFMVEISFNDGRKGTADLENTFKGHMFEPLRQKSKFSALPVDRDLETIVWPNGADLAPEYLYFQAFKADPELQEQFKAWHGDTSPNKNLNWITWSMRFLKIL